MVFPISLVVLIGFIFDYYAEAVCINRMDIYRTARVGSMATFTAALILSCFWNHPFVHFTDYKNINDIEDHMLSGGVIFSFVLFMFGMCRYFIVT